MDLVVFSSHFNGHPINAKPIAFQQNLPKIPAKSYILSLTVPIYTLRWREAVSYHENTTQCPRPGLAPGAIDLETSALTTVPPGVNAVYFK